jgi:hypothetical protein
VAPPLPWSAVATCRSACLRSRTPSARSRYTPPPRRTEGAWTPPSPQARADALDRQEGAGQGRYYLDKVAEGAEDYYSGEAEAEGYWLGDGGEDLGLQGKVEPTSSSQC